jgi:hypothetical protein
MKYGYIAVMYLCLSTLLSQGSLAQDSERKAFDRKMYAVVSLPHFGTSPGQFAGLTVGQRRSLLACRDILISLFQSLDSNTNFAQYLTPDQAKKYRTPADLVAPETSLMEVGILDWDVKGDGKEIQLRFFTVVSSEGDLALTKNTATLKVIGSGWRIAKLDWNTE